MESKYKNPPTPRFLNKTMTDQNIEIKVLAQACMNASDLSTGDGEDGVTIYNLLQIQDWHKFVTTEFEVYENMVVWFYKHVELCGPRADEIIWKVQLRNEEGIEGLEYGELDLQKDFQVPSIGEAITWDMIEENLICNISDNWKSDMRFGRHGYPRWNLLRVVQTIIVPTMSHEELDYQVLLTELLKKRIKLKLSKAINLHMHKVLKEEKLKLLPYGGLITHIVKKWGTMNPGPFMSRSLLYNSYFFTNQIKMATVIRQAASAKVSDDTTTRFTQTDFQVKTLEIKMKAGFKLLRKQVFDVRRKMQKGCKRQKRMVNTIQTVANGFIEDAASERP